MWCSPAPGTEIGFGEAENIILANRERLRLRRLSSAWSNYEISGWCLFQKPEEENRKQCVSHRQRLTEE
jgi:hypothetical protein